MIGTPATTFVLPAPLSALSSQSLRQLAFIGMLRLCLRAALFAEAVEDLPLSVDDQNQLISRYCQQHQIADQQALADHLRLQGLDLPALFQQLGQPLRHQLKATSAYGPKAEARFLDRKNALDQIRYSLVRVSDADLARELYFRIEQGESSFATVAAEFAEGPERQTQGLVGPVPLTQAHPVLAEKLRTATPGILLSPFQIETWWLLVRLEHYRPAVFDDVTAQAMARELFEEAVDADVERLHTAILSSLNRTSVPG